MLAAIWSHEFMLRAQTLRGELAPSVEFHCGRERCFTRRCGCMPDLGWPSGGMRGVPNNFEWHHRWNQQISVAGAVEWPLFLYSNEDYNNTLWGKLYMRVQHQQTFWEWQGENINTFVNRFIIGTVIQFNLHKITNYKESIGTCTR